MQRLGRLNTFFLVMGVLLYCLTLAMGEALAEGVSKEKEVVGLYTCTDRYGSYNEFPKMASREECEAAVKAKKSSWFADSCNNANRDDKDWRSYSSGLWYKSWTSAPNCRGHYVGVHAYFGKNPSGEDSRCPESHPHEREDGLCYKAENENSCERFAATHGSPNSSGGFYDLSKQGIFTPKKDGTVCAAIWDGLSWDNPGQEYCQYKMEDGAISLGAGEYSGKFVPTGGVCLPAVEDDEPDLDEPDTPEQCEKRAAVGCMQIGEHAAGSEVIDGFCFYSCSANKPEKDPPPKSPIDDDEDGTPNVNDPTHPDYDPDDPHSDKDGDGVPNYKDPNHPTYIGGGGSIGNIEGANERLDLLIQAQLENNRMSDNAQKLLAQNLAEQEKQGRLTRESIEGGDPNSDGEPGDGGEDDESIGMDDVYSAFMGAFSQDGARTEALEAQLRGYAGLGDERGVDIIPEKEFNLDDYGGDFSGLLGVAGSCPSPISINIAGNSYEFSWQSTCDVLAAIRVILIFCAYIGAAFIVFGGSD